MKPKVLITAKEVHEIIEVGLKNLGYEVIHLPEPTENELLEIIAEYEGIIVTTYTQLNQKVLNLAEQLKFIGRVGSGLENIDVEFAKQKGIVVLSSPEGNANAVGEHALGLLLNVMNKISQANKEVKNGIWQREENRGEELDGKTVGIIGLGHTGSAFARKLRGFDVKVLAYDKFKTNYATDWIQEVELDELLEKSDVISLHIPFLKENYHFIDQEKISKMSQNPYLIHTCRGEVIDTISVLDALKSNSIKGLGIDVYEDEPWTKDKQVSLEIYQELFSLDQVLATPHIGGWTIESKIKLAQILMEKIATWKNSL
ncbi:MAG TPA: NAD(P)-dependent oxidoreductase [Chitinophagales bacterium]|nr:NAD(P)-dependent oxidoreductase [Chitinophagales bacterium]